MEEEENLDRDWNYVKKTKGLIEAAQDAYDELVKVLGRPFKLDKLGDEKIRVAVQAKKMTLTDAKDILQIMQDLEKMIGIDNGKLDLKEKGPFKGGAPEARFKNKPKKRR